MRDDVFPDRIPVLRPSDYMSLVEAAFAEDLGDLGDVTSLATVPDESCGAFLLCKDEGILAGAEVFNAVFRRADPDLDVAFSRRDGEEVHPGDRVARVRGKARSVLSAERTALNFLGYLSGIATAAHRLSRIGRDAGGVVVLDTRKTLPGYRALSKYAVAVGGGRNHRRGLYDMVLVKNNHIDAAGSVARAVERVRARWGARFAVEVECRDMAEVDQALAAGADVLMLDNMDAAAMKAAVERIDGRAAVEASGNMDAAKIAAAGAAGVGFASVGALTHSVRCLDFSLRIDRR
jgi:nicotinate-nucleotide pyrophosphorylase (carboxylating)